MNDEQVSSAIISLGLDLSSTPGRAKELEPIFRENGQIICFHYGFMETLETMVTTFLAEALLTFRHHAVLWLSGSIILAQWIIALYVMSQSSKGTDQVALLLPVPTFPLPELPDLPPYHAFDGLAFLAIMVVTVRANRRYGVLPLMRIIQQDGIIYFFVLFSSNLVWLLLLLHARPALKFLHNQLSTIMINRITLNLKQSRHTDLFRVYGHGTANDVELQKLGHGTAQSNTFVETFPEFTSTHGKEQSRISQAPTC
ncbi:hypothetical protein CVT26_014873 [Gymnopilus dilepis]|uniref:Uncharacterized protein n=1 Tax=Gymnopilus dilepis TaxID=231916 RepID=A0A409XX22_9AGAR|nr:hypothetical protein CVT26_014873 [Gymnopilus dilepis]